MIFIISIVVIVLVIVSISLAYFKFKPPQLSLREKVRAVAMQHGISNSTADWLVDNFKPSAEKYVDNPDELVKILYLRERNPDLAFNIGDVSYKDQIFPNIQPAEKHLKLSEEAIRLGYAKPINIERNGINLVGNVTLYSPQPIEDVWKAVNVTQLNPEIVNDFNNPNQHMNVVKLLKYIPEIEGYPLAIQASAFAVDNVVYKNNFDKVKGDDYIWQYGIRSAIAYVINLQNSGKIDVLNGLNMQNKTLQRLFLEKAILPVELTTQNITSGGHTDPSFDVFIYNVTPNANLNGSQPQEWLGNILRKSIADKDELYDLAMYFAYMHHPYVPWPNSGNAYKALFNTAKNVDELSLYVIGIPDALRYPNPKPVVPEITEASVPYYSVLVGRELGYPTVVYTAPYPDGKGFEHDEAGVWSDKMNSIVVYWCDIPAFIADYQNSPIEPNLKRSWNFGEYEIIVG